MILKYLLIAHPEESNEIENLIRTIRKYIIAKCENENRPYVLSIGIGYEEYDDEDSFQKCILRADEKLYIDKENCKKSGKSTICK